ncbi:MAG: hypothetical protein KDA57_03915 [Planctomycetales bacterium]|nr:hypothetical protein [Planctomycetales bacterium]
MASVTEPRPPQYSSEEIPRKGERLVDEQIRRTRRSLKMVDLAAGTITLVIGVLMFLLATAVLEHWIIPGGWNSTARAALFIMLLLGVAWYSWQVFWPLLHQPINPAYAALAIEKSSPSLKNSLLNLLLLRSHRRQLSQQVYQAIEQQAAQRLAQVPIESVVDRSAVLRLGYILVAVVALCALYRILSPKDLVASAGRVLLPWSDITVPSRVQLSAITPGNTQTAKGDQVEVAAEVLGLETDEPVRLLYSTADQQIVEQEILMTAATGGVQFKAKLPGHMAGSDGVQQDLVYWIEAGDARSPRYQVSVFARPTLVVQSVRYDYPDYTGYPSHEEQHSGDIHAVEGTVVTITALANQPIESAHVDFEADGRDDLMLKADGLRASVSFPLELRDDRRTPRYGSYVLRYVTTEGRRNKLPPKYQIEVTPDYAPEIRILSPEEEIVSVGLDEQVVIEVEARDPDFAVRNVAILGELAGQQVLKESLLAKNHTGRFVGRLQFTPEERQLKVGDVLEYWGAAADNRRPKANLSYTKHQRIRVVGPGEDGQQRSESQGEGEQGQDSPQPGEKGQPDSDQSNQGEAGGSEGESGQEGNEGQQGQGQSGAGQDGEGGSDEQQQQRGQAGEGNSTDSSDESPSDSEGQSGGKSAGNENSQSQEDNRSQQQEEGGNPSDNSAGGENGNRQEKVSPDGDDDGEAFDRIAEHFDEQTGQAQDQQAQKTNQGERGGQQQPQQDQSAADGKADSDQGDQGEDSESAASGKEGASTENEGRQQETDAEAPGAEGASNAEQNPEGNEQATESREEGGPDGRMSPEQAPAGAGENPGQNEGATEAQGDKKPRDKQADSASGDKQDDQEPPAAGEGQTESDSEGSQGGDRSGGGQEGAGQQADAQGKGGAGENQPADDGGGQSGEPGAGENSQQPGNKEQADDATGESNEGQPGESSKQADKPADSSGSETSGEKGESQQSTPGEGEPSEGQPSGQDSPEGESSPASQQPGGDGMGSKSSLPPPGGETQPGDEANLDYARKKTDLILEKLDDQLKKQETDEKLLEKLGWTPDELRQFVDRWKNLKQQAEGAGSEAGNARRQLDDALRSLGLRSDRRTGFQSQTAKDKLRELQDSYRVKTPLEYQQHLRAYVKGTATADAE